MTESINTPTSAELDRELMGRDIKDLAGGALVTFVGKAGRISRGAFIWVISALCGWDVQGLYTVAWGYVSTLNKIARFGMQRAVVRYVVVGRTEGEETAVERTQAVAMATACVAGTLVAAATYLSADMIAAAYDSPIASAIRIMALSSPFMAVTAVLVASTRALRIMRYDVYVNSIAGPLVLLVGGLMVGLSGWGLMGVAWAQVAMAVGVCALSVYYFRQFFTVSGFVNRLGRGLPWSSMTRFSFPVMLADVLYGLLTQIDVFMLLLFVDAKLVGVYALLRRVASIMLKAFQAFDPIFSPIISELAHRQKYRELSYQFEVASRWILTINLPIFAALFILGDYFMQAAGGERLAGLTPDELKAGVQVLLILCLGMMVQGIFAVGESLLAMEGRPYLNMYNNALWLTANVLLNLWLLPIYGIVGGAIAATASMVVANFARLAQIYRIHGIHPLRRSLLKPLTAAGVPALALWWLRDYVMSGTNALTLLALVPFLGIYLLLLTWFGIETEDRALLQRVATGLRRRLKREG